MRQDIPERLANITGVASEQLDTPQYSYFSLKRGDVETWVVVPRTQRRVGQTLECVNAVLVRDFQSKSLGRRFPQVYFTVLANEEPAHEPMQAPASMSVDSNAPRVSGVVVERIDRAPYTYLLLRLDGGAGETWAAVPETHLPVGAHVAVLRPSNMDGFSSPTLKRTFDRLVFGVSAITLEDNKEKRQ